MLKVCILYNLTKNSYKMDKHIMGSSLMAAKFYLEWKHTKTIIFIMGSGKIMLGMVGEFMKIKD